MPRKSRRQLVGKQEDVERREREEALRALEHELHQQQQEDYESPRPTITEPADMARRLFQAKIMPLTVPL